MSSLYELSAEYHNAFMQIQNAGLDDQTLQDTLEGIIAPVEEKALNVAKFIKSIDNDITGMKSAIKDMQDRVKVKENHQARMNDYLRDNMIHAGIDRIECDYFELAIVATPPKVIIDGDVPAEYLVRKETFTPDKAVIKKACQSGSLTFAHLETGKRLRIK